MSLDIAIVIPWFGEHLKGGAEQQAWQIANRLASRGHQITVLTTCSESFLGSWEVDYFAAGREQVGELTVLRFPLASRDGVAFDQLNAKMMSLEKSSLRRGISPCTSEEETVYLRDNIFSRELDDYIVKEQEKFDYFLFLPYLFPNVLLGIEHVSQKAILQPCLHDESYAYLSCVANAFNKAKHILFNSRGEQALASSIIGPEVYDKGEVVYEGIEPFKGVPQQGRVVVDGPFVLCLGRRDATKNTDFLVDSFNKFKQEYPTNLLALVLAGPGDHTYVGNGVIDCGLVTDNEKQWLLENCVALVNPSEHESFSRVIFEAWMASKPVIVNQHCGATDLALVESGEAGYRFADSNQLRAILFQLSQTDRSDLENLGQSGFIYAREVADWESVMDRYDSLLMQKSVKVSETWGTIHQLLPNLSYGDAISQHALYIRDFLRGRGIQSKIYVRYVDPRVAHECEVYKPGKIRGDEGLIYHHSIGFEHTQAAVDHTGSKALIYHNITPKDFFEQYDPEFAAILRKGRAELPEIVNSFDLVCGDSKFNLRELELLGKQERKCLPIPMYLKKWDCIPDHGLADVLSDGLTNILFVGRIAPNKKQTDLVVLLDYLLRLRENYRLVLCGGAAEGDLYLDAVIEQVDQLGLADRVLILNHVSDETLKVAYQQAAAFVSMSEHEGLGIPLIEAMWFDLPVFAFSSSAVPETLGDAGILLKDKRHIPQFACVIDEVLHDDELLDRLLAAQKKRRQAFLASNLQEEYENIMNALA